jgi:predicted transcriptional regulator
MTRTQTPISIRISPQAEGLRAALAAKLGVNKSAVIEMAIRRMAAREKVTLDVKAKPT